MTKERIEKILKAGANVVLTTKGIDDMALKVSYYYFGHTILVICFKYVNILHYILHFSCINSVLCGGWGNCCATSPERGFTPCCQGNRGHRGKSLTLEIVSCILMFVFSSTYNFHQ